MEPKGQSEIGDAVPVAELRDDIKAAVMHAGTGRCTFASQFEVTVEFAVTDAGTDVYVRGLGDLGEVEFCVVGDFRYGLTNTEERPWKWDDLTSTDPLDRFIVEMGRDSTAIGTPLGLLEGMHGLEAIVVERSGSVTTFQVPVRVDAFWRAYGDLSRSDSGENTLDTLWEVGSDRLVQRVRAEALPVVFEFSDWGNPLKVAAPPADQAESNKEWLINGAGFN